MLYESLHRIGWAWLCGWAALSLVTARATAAQPAATPVLINLLEEVWVPAREAGVLLKIEVQEGDRVQEGQRLAQIDDAESQQLLRRAKLESDIAAKNAANQLGVQTAEKTRAVAKAIFARTSEGAQKFKNTISQTELDRLQLDADKAELAWQQAQHELEVAKLTLQLKQADCEAATRSVERRQITAPLGGVVVEVTRRRGEWVEPGNKVLRVMRVDRVRAEGFLDARQARGPLKGSRVTLQLDAAENLSRTFSGKLTFVSPEVDPVNGQVRVLAEIDNSGEELKPGLHATMLIQPQ